MPRSSSGSIHITYSRNSLLEKVFVLLDTTVSFSFFPHYWNIVGFLLQVLALMRIAEQFPATVVVRCYPGAAFLLIGNAITLQAILFVAVHFYSPKLTGCLQPLSI